MRERLRRQPAGTPEHAGLAAAARLAALPEFRAARAVGLFLATPREPDTAPLIEAAARAGCRIALPAHDPDTGVYRYAWWTPGTALRRGPDGMREPAVPAWAAGRDLDLAVVPGIAFDRRGGRLGRGGGHFDRLLGDRPVCVAGLTREGELVERVPQEAHDRRMDVVVTEDAVYRAGAPAAHAGRTRP